MSSTEHILSDEQLKELTLELFKPDVFSRALPLDELQMNLNMLRTTSEPNLRRWLDIFETESILQRTMLIEATIARRKKRQLEAAGRSQPESVAVDVEEAGMNPQMSVASKFSTASTEADDSDSESEVSGDNETDAHHPLSLSAEVGCQVALVPADALVNLESVDLKPPAAAKRLSRNNSEIESHDMAGTYDDGEVSQQEERWVRLAAAVIHAADVKAAKLPAASALKKHKEEEARANRQVQELIEKIEKTKEALEAARNEHNGLTTLSKRDDDFTAEREDLEITRAAIKEAREEIEQLKLKIEEQQKKLKPAPSMIGRMRDVGHHHHQDDAAAERQVLDRNGHAPPRACTYQMCVGTRS
jgi:DNA repair exonuclease SbcCD ATPase subunit